MRPATALGRADCDGAGDLFVFDMGHTFGATAVDGVGRRAVKKDFSTTTSGTEFGAVSAAF